MRQKKGLLSVSYLAERAGTSRTTIRRFLKTKGYEGKLDLTMDMAGELLEGFADWKREREERMIAGGVKKDVVEKKPMFDWRVSIRGDYGWIVVRVGTQEEMEAWAALLVRNGIEARASRNEFGEIVNA